MLEDGSITVVYLLENRCSLRITHPEKLDAAAFEISALLDARLPVVECGGVQISALLGQIFLEGEGVEEERVVLSTESY
jgi:hypothetical protein